MTKRRSSAEIKKKIDFWIKDPLMQTGAGRLIIYLEKKDIREEFLVNIPEDLLNEWDENISLEDIDRDMAAAIETTMQHLSQMNITAGLGYVPLIIADLYVLKQPTAALEAEYRQILMDYVKKTVEDTQTALLTVLVETTDMFKKLIKKHQIELSFDLDTVLEEIINTSTMIKKDFGADLESKEVMTSIDEAIAKYEEETGEKLFDETNDGYATQEEIEALDEITIVDKDE